MRGVAAVVITVAILLSAQRGRVVAQETVCIGDCNGDAKVQIAELVTAVGIALGRFPPSRCANIDAAFIDVLIRAVRNSLHGCPHASSEDFSNFSRFDFLRSVGFGFCPPHGSTMAATIRRDGDERYVLKRTFAAPGEEGVDACLIPGRFGGACTVGEVEGCHVLSAAEVERVRAAFAAVTLFPGPTPQCGVEDPCLIHRVTWDGGQLTDDECGDRYLPASSVDEIAALLDSLGDGEEIACPQGLCRPADIFLCNDGNDVGGDGCAANCAEEAPLRCELGPESALDVQLAGSALELGLEGAHTFAAGATGTLYALTLSPQGYASGPTVLSGLGCVCLRGRVLPALGSGLMGSGAIECGPVQEPNVVAERDRDTAPGSAGNTGGSTDDLECDDTADSLFTAGPASRACREGIDPECGDSVTGACRGPLHSSVSGGDPQAGSALIAYNLALTFLGDGGRCDLTSPGEPCAYPAYGPDCLPCTDDDTELGRADLVVAVTGEARGALVDAHSATGPAVIDDEHACGGGPCETSLRGRPLDCGQLAAGVMSGDLVAAWPRVGDPAIGDAVVKLRFSCAGSE